MRWEEGAFPAGGLQRWALHWHLGQGWGLVTLLLVTPKPQAIPGISAHKAQTNTGAKGGSTTRSGHP